MLCSLTTTCHQQGRDLVEFITPKLALQVVKG
jgi:hypothetical protein